MSIKAKLQSRDGEIADFLSRDFTGPVVHAFDGIVTEPSTKFFLNDDFGAAMNQNIGFSGTPDIIHNGTDTSAYTGSNIAGAQATFNDTDFAVQAIATIVDWSLIDNGDSITINGTEFAEDDTPTGNQFLAETSDAATATNLATAISGVAGLTAAATAAVVSITNTDGTGITSLTTSAAAGEMTVTTPKAVKVDGMSAGDVFQFAKGSDLTLANFTAITMWIYVDKNWGVSDSTSFYGYDSAAAAQVGDAVLLQEYFDFTDFDTWHSIVIPLGDMGLASAATVDAFRVEQVATSGPKPVFYLDKLQVEASGTPAVFKVNVDRADRFHIEELVFAYADALDATLANGTMPALAYNQILGVTALPTGFTITRSRGGKTLFVASVKTLGAHLSAGAKADLPWTDGTNTFVTLRAIFDRPLILSGAPGDILTITINDDMSGLLQFTAAARGGLETG